MKTEYLCKGKKVGFFLFYFSYVLGYKSSTQARKMKSKKHKTGFF